MKPLVSGDYVLATKYSDGDPKDGWAIGFFTHMTDKGRFMVIDSDGNAFRGNGFRRARRIPAQFGLWIVGYKKEIESSSRSLWGWLRHLQRTKGNPKESTSATPAQREGS